MVIAGLYTLVILNIITRSSVQTQSTNLKKQIY